MSFIVGETMTNDDIETALRQSQSSIQPERAKMKGEQGWMFEV